MSPLKMIKLYLSKEIMVIQERNRLSEDKVLRFEEEIREMRKTNNNYLEKLTDKNCNLENTFEDKLKRELEDMKKKYQVEYENLKKLFIEIGEKRSEYLLQEREDLSLKVKKKLENIIKDKEEGYDFLNKEFRTLQKRSSEEMAMLNIDLSVKKQELDHLSNLHKEHLDIIKVLSTEKEVFKEKIDCLRIELVNKESFYKENTADTKAHLAILKEKIANYEQIETELDKVIIGNLDDKDVLPILKDIPTASKRRISQCLILANKINLCNVEIEKLNKIIKNLEDDKKKFIEELDFTKNSLERSKQPYQYLVKNIETQERELAKRGNIIEELNQTNRNLIRENDLQDEKIKSLENDLKVILANRSKLDNLEGMIMNYMNIENESKMKENNLKQSFNKPNYQFLTQAEKDTNFNSKVFKSGGLTNNETGMDTKNLLVLSNNNNEDVPEWYLKLQKNKKNY